MLKDIKLLFLNYQILQVVIEACITLTNVVYKVYLLYNFAVLFLYRYTTSYVILIDNYALGFRII